MAAPISKRSGEQYAGRSSQRRRVLPDAALLGIQAGAPDELRRAVERGLEFHSWESVQAHAGLSTRQMSEVLQMNVKTIGRRKESGRLTAVESDRLSRLSRILAQAIELFEGDEKAAQGWLVAPRDALGGSAPLELIRTEVGAREVERMIERLEDGVFS